jgi:prolyl 4-hydroxylase
MSDNVICEPAQQDHDAIKASAHSSLVTWVTDRHAEDYGPAQMFNVMCANGWVRADAVAAMLEALPSELHDEVRMLLRGAPDPDLGSSSGAITIDGHAVQVLFEMRNPRLIVYGNLLTRDECDELIASASPPVTNGTELVVSDETPLRARLGARIAALLDWPATYAEDMQVLRYDKDQQYEPQHDFFDASGDEKWSPEFRRGGQRVGSMVIYLNTPPLGGSTVFPDIPMEVHAVGGNAVFFAYDTPDATSRTLHGGAPVSEGEKWVALMWFRQGPFA